MQTIIQNRNYYKALFAPLPEIVDVKQLMQMLGGVNEKTARAILWRREIPAVLLNNRYLIPKRNVIDYLLSSGYQEVLARVAAASCKKIPSDLVEANRQRILMLCDRPKSRRELMAILGVSSKKTFFRLYLYPLIKEGKLRMTVTSQNSVSTQKYVRVGRF